MSEDPMVEQAKTPSGANAPYKHMKQGGKWVVKNNAGEVKASFPGTPEGEAKSLAYMRALYAAVPGAGKRAARTPFTGKAKNRIKAEADRRNAIAQKVAVDPKLTRHAFLSDVDNRCLTCKQIMLHPLHGVDADGVTPVVDAVNTDALTRTEALPGMPVLRAEYTGSGCMVALYPDDKGLAGVTTDGDLPLEPRDQLHVTLAFLPTTPSGDDLVALQDLVKDVGRLQGPLTGVWGGTARFNPSEGSDGKPVLVALPDLPELPEFRQTLVEALEAAGFPPSESHGYTPHMTVAYDDNGRVRAQGPISFDTITLAAGGQKFSYPLTGEIEMDPESAALDADAAGKLAQGVDAGVDAALTLLRSTPDLPPYAAQAQALLQGIEPACDELLEFFGVSDADDDDADAEDQATQDRLVASATVRERDLVPEPASLPELPATKAFLTEVHGRTLLTAPASTFIPTWEKALTPNEHMLWMQGRFVGAEKANRNGAFWSTSDLEMGEPTVKHGPLNWLHEAKHVIGTIADAKLVVPDLETAAADGSAFAEPHIMAMAAVWKWIYPDEAFVMEEASDQGKLWYSMECVSREVACAGDSGCGKSYPYMDVIKASDNVCAHIRQRSSTRHFVDPTFLGGAVIVPPVRPGWADADARVLREAASLAERAFEQAGEPDMPASQWEALMAQVVGYASR